jgi:hypothetical protein
MIKQIRKLSPQRHITEPEKATRSKGKANRVKLQFERTVSLSIKVIGWLISMFSVENTLKSRLMPEICKFCNTLFSLFETRGTAGVIEFVKLTRQSLYLKLSGEYLSKTVQGVPLRADGVPASIGSLYDLVESLCHVDKGLLPFRALTTILSFTRALKSKFLLDTNSISDPSSMTSTCLGPWVNKFWKKLRITHLHPNKVPRMVHFQNYHMTSKSGPNGQALITSIADLYIISQDIKLLRSICTVGGPKLEERIWGLIEQMAFLTRSHPRYKTKTLRKLSYFADKEGKYRVVAILDYFSQTALLGFHRWLYKILKRIPQDCTYHQGKFKETIKDWKEFSSVDLSNATDRFPILFIKGVLGPIFPKSFLDAWEYIMVGIGYDLNYKGKQYCLKYSVGTPMGAYTSWASFALAHHALVFHCCEELGIEWSTSKYFLLGDDILFGDQNLAKVYKDKISLLGVKISPHKTYDSTEFFEFAKRIFYKGVEITPFPISAVVNLRRFYQLLPIFDHEKERSWDFGERVSDAIRSYHQHVLGFNAKFCKEVYNKVLVMEELMLTVRGAQTGLKCLNALLVCRGREIPTGLTDEVANSTISSCLADLFHQSDPLSQSNTDKARGKPLGLLAETLVMRLTGSEDAIKVEWSCNHISSVPLLNVYGQICEAYLELKKEAKANLSISLSWPLYLKTLGLPLSDSVFVERQRDRLVRATSQIAFKLEGKLDEMLERYKAQCPDYGEEGGLKFNLLSSEFNTGQSTDEVVYFQVVTKGRRFPRDSEETDKPG